MNFFFLGQALNGLFEKEKTYFCMPLGTKLESEKSTYLMISRKNGKT